jgi:hypothetical protein
MTSSSHPRFRFPRDFSLSLTLFGIFLLLSTCQTIAGRAALNDELRDHGQPPISIVQYLRTGLCWESLSENWESEFLEMGVFVWFTSFLYQRGSPESNDPDAPDSHKRALTARSPWPARRGGWIRALYARSLSLAFLLLFFLALSIHAVAGAGEHNRQQQLHGQPAISTLEFLKTSEFWFQSLQNWQSEFLGIAAMVLLAIWLRQEGSPESKDVNTPHIENE